MTTKHKIGIHVSSEHRDCYGDAAPHSVAVTSFQDGAFLEVDEKCIKIYRTHEEGDHKDAPIGFDDKHDDELFSLAEWWWQNRLRDRFLPIRELYGENTYFQPTNEINNPRIITYLRGMVSAAEKDGVKLALLGDAAGSPDWESWVKEWVPFLRDIQGKGHIYVRHVYTELPHDKFDPTIKKVKEGKKVTEKHLQTYLTTESGSPADSNSFRPFHEASYLRKSGIQVPLLISELGWRAGWNALPEDWLNDLMRYNDLMVKHSNIIGCCVWNAGNWGGRNILSGPPLKALGHKLAGIQPVYYDPKRVQSKIKAAAAVVDTPKRPSSRKGDKTFDLLSYMRGSNGKQYIIKTRKGDQAGSQERYRYEIDKPDKHWYIVKNHQWEKYHWDGKWIYSDMDTSPDGQRFYVVRKTRGGNKLAERCPRFMKVGQKWFGATHWVQFYEKDSLSPSSLNSGEAANSAEFLKAGTWVSPDGHTYEDTITLKLGTEIQIYQKGRGRIGWESGWGASSVTPEDVNHQHPIGREKIGFLGE